MAINFVSAINLSGEFPHNSGMVITARPRVSITHRVFARTLALFVGLAITLTLVLVVETLWQAREGLRTELEIYQRSFERSMAEAQWALDRQKLDSIVSGIIEIPAITGVRVVDPERGGEIIKAGIIPDAQEATPYALLHRFDLIHDGGLGRETVGVVEFHSSFAEVLARSQRKIVLIVSLGLLKTLALWWIFTLVGHRLLVRPLDEMVRAIDGTPIAEPMKITPATSRAIDGTELGVLRTVFDELTERVRITQDALEKMNHDLERRVSERTNQLEEANRRLETLAHTDPLTGLANRRQFITESQRLIAHARRTHRPLSLIVCDIDSFKQVNDVHGHTSGDQVICQVAHSLRSTVREEDIVGRFGGDEFVVLLPDSCEQDARAVALRLCEHARTSRDEIEPDTAPRFTLSCGVAELRDTDERLEDMFLRADHRLYLAKELGRDRVVSSDETDDRTCA